MIPEIENEATFKSALASGINLFAGAGFSILAKDKNERSLPIGGALAKELIDYFNLPKLKGLDLPKLCTVIEATSKEKLHHYLTERFSVGHYDALYNSIKLHAIKSVITTNIDNLTYKIYSGSLDHYINDISQKGPSFNDKQAIDYFPLHGTVALSENKYIFTNIDISSAFSLDANKWQGIIRKMQEHPTVFWGYGLHDAGALASLDGKVANERQLCDRWIVIPEKDEAQIEYLKAIGFQIIIADTKSFLNYLSSVSAPKQKKVDGDLLKQFSEKFSDFHVPSVGDVPVRPILSFYLGQEPTWYDVFNGKLVKVSYFSKILEFINKGRNVMIVGIAGAGKTTLLMQLASELKQSIKLISSNMPEGKAKIISNMAKERIYVFIDNITDSVAGVNILAKNRNIIIIGADREYNFETVSHKLLDLKPEVVNVTEISRQDAQAVYSKIPHSARRDNLKIKASYDSKAFSILDLVEQNVKSQMIYERYTSVIAGLRKINPDLLEMLLACCYAHYTRTPIPFYTLYSYFKPTYTIEQTYDMIDKLGRMIVDTGGDPIPKTNLGAKKVSFVDDTQDYFVARSYAMAERVIDKVYSEDLRRVIIRFNSKISPYSIPQYDVFKRRAYESDLIEKAFTDWTEGKAFYESMRSRDQSPYLLQQAAIYLMHHKQYKEAFKFIDEALLATNGRVFTIRNTHAVVLFESNINQKKSDPTVRATLVDSLDVIHDCCKHDKKKLYHAKCYANQSMKFFEAFPREKEAMDHLLNAQKWLRQEQAASLWDREAKLILKTINEMVEKVFKRK